MLYMFWKLSFYIVILYQNAVQQYVSICFIAQLASDLWIIHGEKRFLLFAKFISKFSLGDGRLWKCGKRGGKGERREMLSIVKYPCHKSFLVVFGSTQQHKSGNDNRLLAVFVWFLPRGWISIWYLCSVDNSILMVQFVNIGICKVIESNSLKLEWSSEFP